MFWSSHCREVRLCSYGKNNPINVGIKSGIMVKEEEAEKSGLLFPGFPFRLTSLRSSMEVTGIMVMYSHGGGKVLVYGTPKSKSKPLPLCGVPDTRSSSAPLGFFLL